MTDFDERPPSRSARKREVEALQKLGERLLTMTSAQLANLPLPDDLRRAVADASAMKAHGALRRQRQYIGRLMREIDVEPLRVAMQGLEERRGSAVRAHHHIEQWRDRLVSEGENALEQALAEFPGVDPARLAGLIRQAINDRTPKGKRELFRYLRDLGGESGINN